jgi:hypothetical protein
MEKIVDIVFGLAKGESGYTGWCLICTDETAEIMASVVIPEGEDITTYSSTKRSVTVEQLKAIAEILRKTE